jgi:hypothetical protein
VAAGGNGEGITGLQGPFETKCENWKKIYQKSQNFRRNPKRDVERYKQKITEGRGANGTDGFTGRPVKDRSVKVDIPNHTCERSPLDL